MTFFSCSWPRCLVWVQQGALLVILMLALPVHAQTDGLSVGETLSQSNLQVKRADGRSVDVGNLMGEKGTALVFWSNDCPWTDRYEDRLQALIRKYKSSGIQFVLVNASDIADSSKEALQALQSYVERRGFRVPYVWDSNARLAQALGATRTPHVYLFDGEERLIYKGAIDDNPSGASQVEQSHLQNALEALLAGETPENTKTKAFGCSLKY